MLSSNQLGNIEGTVGWPRTRPDMPGAGQYTQSDSSGQHWYGVDADWVVLGGGARWRHVVNRIEPVQFGDF